MNLKLIKLQTKHKNMLFELMDEWTSTGEVIIPYSIVRADYHRYIKFLQSLKLNEQIIGLPNTTYFCIDIDKERFIGAVNIRHKLDDRYLLSGGHIADGVRPSLRGQGYGTILMRLAIQKCRELGIRDVLITCDKNNIASAKTIINNSGKLENELFIGGRTEQRYWVRGKGL